MSITLRTRKDGTSVYEIRISRGRDPETGKQLTPYVRRFLPPADCPPAKAEKLAQKEEKRLMTDIAAGRAKAGVYNKKGKEDKQAEQELLGSLGGYIDFFLKSRRLSCRVSTLNNYRNALSHMVEFFGKAKFIKDISAEDMCGFVEWMANDKHYVASTLEQYTLAVHIMLLSAVDNGIIPKMPYKHKRDISIVKKELKDDSKKFFSGTELKLMMTQINKLSISQQLLFYLLMETGCRMGELCALHWSEVDIATGRICILASMQYTGSTYFRSITKNGCVRNVYLSPNGRAIKLLAQAREYYQTSGFADNEYVMLNSIGNPMLPSAGARLCNKLERMCGGAIDIHPHKFRHTMITKALQAGVDIATVSKMAGHSSVDITARNYAHSDDEAKRMGSEALAKYFGNLM